MTPIDPQQAQQTAQVLLTFLSDENVSVPANLIEGIVNGKAMLRGILSNQLFICAATPAPAAKAETGKPKDTVVEDEPEDEDEGKELVTEDDTTKSAD